MASAGKQKASEIEEIHESSGSEDEQPQASSANGPSASSKKKKKKSKAKKALDALRGKSNGDDEIPQPIVDRVMDVVQSNPSALATVPKGELTEANVRAALQQLKIMDVVQGKAGLGGLNRKDMGEHKFWATQPVPQPGEGSPVEDGFIEPSKPVSEVKQDPYPLPKDFEWTVLDIMDDKQNQEVHSLLSLNYVEDDNAAFRFQYSAEFLRWALTPPGFHKEWHIGVRVASNKKLVAFISGVPLTLRVRNHVIHTSEINFLCVHKKLRYKRLAPVLIKEVTRQCHLKGIFQAIYTGGIVIPTPVSTCRYYHRLMNIPKLLDVKFCFVPRNSTQLRMTRLHKVPDKLSMKGLREMRSDDVVAVADLFTKYMQRFDMFPIFELEELKHHLLSGRGQGEVGDGGPGKRKGQVTWTYVVEDPDTGRITDFFSFYSLPSTVINNTTYPTLEAAYLYYYATDAGLKSPKEQTPELNARVQQLIGDAIIVADRAKFDVFNALTLMDNVPALTDLKFGVGDGFLNFYLYNWRTNLLAGIEATDGVPAGKGVGVVML